MSTDAHWLEMDWFEQRQAHTYLDSCYDPYEGVEGYQFDHYAAMQSRRLQSLAQEMKRRNIIDISNRLSDCSGCRWFVDEKPDAHVNLHQRYCISDQFAAVESTEPIDEPIPKRICGLFEWDMPRKRLYETNLERRRYLIESHPVVANFWQLTRESRGLLNEKFVTYFGAKNDKMQVIVIDSKKALYEIMSGLRSVTAPELNWVGKSIDSRKITEPS